MIDTSSNISEVFLMPNSQVCTLRIRNGSKSLRLNIRYSPSKSGSDFAPILRAATTYFLNGHLE